MDTAVGLVSAYLHFNGYMTVPEQPVLIGAGEPVQYHTATDIDLLAVRFPFSAVVVPRDGGVADEDDLEMMLDPLLDIPERTVDVLIAEVKEGRPRLNAALRDPDVLYATLRRIDPGFERPIEDAVTELIERGEAWGHPDGRPWRIRLVAFGAGPVERQEEERFTVIQLRHIALFLLRRMAEDRNVWNDAQFADPVLDLLHLFDKLGLLTSDHDE